MFRQQFVNPLIGGVARTVTSHYNRISERKIYDPMLHYRECGVLIEYV